MAVQQWLTLSVALFALVLQTADWVQLGHRHVVAGEVVHHRHSHAGAHDHGHGDAQRPRLKSQAAALESDAGPALSLEQVEVAGRSHASGHSHVVGHSHAAEHPHPAGSSHTDAQVQAVDHAEVARDAYVAESSRSAENDQPARPSHAAIEGQEEGEATTPRDRPFDEEPADPSSTELYFASSLVLSLDAEISLQLHRPSRSELQTFPCPESPVACAPRYRPAAPRGPPAA
ncbi:MAG: hypothetical protein AAGD01_13980 [Acidobacteriota bacterium]